MNIANNMGLRFKHNLSALDWTINSPIHKNTFGPDDSIDMRSTSDNQGRAVQFTLNLTVDLYQPLCGDPSDNLQPFGDDGSTFPRSKHCHLLKRTCTDRIREE